MFSETFWTSDSCFLLNIDLRVKMLNTGDLAFRGLLMNLVRIPNCSSAFICNLHDMQNVNC